MPTMTSSPRLLVHGHHQPATPIVVHHPNLKGIKEKTAAVSSCDLCAPKPAVAGLPLESMPVFAGCNPLCSDDHGKPVVTYGFAEPRRGSRWSLQESPVLEYKVPRPLRSLATKTTNKRYTATPSRDDGKIQSRRIRTPPPTPKPRRLLTPDLSDLECDTFCSCCKSTNENTRLVKAKSKRSARIDQEKQLNQNKKNEKAV